MKYIVNTHNLLNDLSEKADLLHTSIISQRAEPVATVDLSEPFADPFHI